MKNPNIYTWKTCGFDPSDTGTLYYAQKRYIEAIPEFNKTLKTDPQNFWALYHKGMCFLRLDCPKDALECFEQAILVEPDIIKIWYAKGVALATLGQFEKAIECYDKAIWINLYKFKDTFRVTYPHKDDHKISLLHACWTNEIIPEYVFSLNGKGVALFYLSQYDKAIKCFDDALLIQSDPESALHFIKKAISSEGLDGKISILIDGTLSLDRSFFDSWNNKGVTLVKLNQYNQAIDCFEKIIRFYNDSTNLDLRSLRNAWYHKGIVFEKQGQNKKAQKCFDKSKNACSDFTKPYDKINVLSL